MLLLVSMAPFNHVNGISAFNQKKSLEDGLLVDGVIFTSFGDIIVLASPPPCPRLPQPIDLTT